MKIETVVLSSRQRVIWAASLCAAFLFCLQVVDFSSGQIDALATTTSLESKDADIVHDNDPYPPSPVCRPTLGDDNNITRIVFLHMRKAGGTTVGFLLRRVAKKYNLEYKEIEGHFDPEMRTKRNSTFYVTNLREPVARAVSNYKYDQRWPCPQLVQNRSFVPSLRNTQHISFESFVTNEYHGLANPRRQLWTCSSNCYARWSTGNLFHTSYQKLVSRAEDNTTNATHNLLEQARESLLEYNLIIITELLKDPTYVKGIEEMFHVEGLGKERPAFCTRESRKANLKFPIVFNPKTLEVLRERNRVDTQLYKEFASCPSGFDFSMQFNPRMASRR